MQARQGRKAAICKTLADPHAKTEAEGEGGCAARIASIKSSDTATCAQFKAVRSATASQVSVDQ